MKNGISLVALVITIIVLIILTGAVIATFIEGGIIDQAKDAVKRSDYTTLIETYDTAYNVEKVDIATGTGGVIDEIELLEKTVNELGLKGFTFTEDRVSYNGDNDYISGWVKNNFVLKGLQAEGFQLSTINKDSYLLGMKIETSAIVSTAGEILEKLGNDYKIVDTNGEQAEKTDTVTTGYKIIKDNETYAIIVVKGDVNSSNTITIDDAQMIGAIIRGEQEANSVMLLASDMNNDGIVSSSDATIVNILLLGMVTEEEYNQMQNVVAKDPVIQSGDDGYIWYDKSSLLSKISEKYTITDESTITLPSNIKCSDLQNDINKIFNTKGTKITLNSGSGYVEAPDEIIEAGDKIRIYMGSWKLNEKEYFNDPSRIILTVSISE